MAVAFSFSSAQAVNLAIANYNIEADVNGDTAPNSGLYAVIEAMGQQTEGSFAAQPIDILGLEETTSNSATVTPIVTALNAFYGAGTYAMSTYQGTEVGNDPTTGNGPNAMIYDTKVVTLVASVGVSSTPNSSGGAYRQVVRYQFQPVGGTAANSFYVYVSHMKSSASGSTQTVQADRATEASEIRADEATLPTGSSVIYMGDFNMDGSTETAYKTLTGTGQGQGVDPLNTSNDYTQTWNSSTYKGELTESDTAIAYRDDLQLISSNVYNGTAASGLKYVSGTYRAFGNNNTTAFGADVDQTSNTALATVAGGTAYQQTILGDLDTASDHLPIIADYTIALPEPGTNALLGCGMALLGFWAWRSRLSIQKDKSLL